MSDNREMIVLNGEQIDELVRCKDCKHRPIPNGNNHPLTPKPSEFEWDETCPYVCADEWHNEMPEDNDFCSKGERKDERKENGK